MMDCSTRLRRACVYVLALALTVTTAPPVGVAAPLLGTIQVSGTAWAASGANDWSRLGSTRPLVSGDHLKTGEDGYLLADMGREGVIGLFADSEIEVEGPADSPIVRFVKGKVAFHFRKRSAVLLRVEGADIVARALDATGYVEYDGDGQPAVIVEEGGLVARVDGVDRILGRGERLTLRSNVESRPARAASDDSNAGRSGAKADEAVGFDEGDDDTQAVKAGVVAVTTAGSSWGGLGTTGWTAIGVVAVAAAGGIGAGVGLSGGGGGGGGDKPGS